MHPRQHTAGVGNASVLCFLRSRSSPRRAVADFFRSVLQRTISSGAIIAVATTGQGLMPCNVAQAAPRVLPAPAPEQASNDQTPAKPTLAETTVRPAIEKAAGLRAEEKHEEALDALRGDPRGEAG